MSGNNTKIYMEQGGETMVAESGAVINIKTGAKLQNNGVDMDLSAGIATATSAVTAELDVLAGVTPGTAKASSAAVLDANLALDVVRTASLMLGASGSEIAVGATAAELNMAADNSANSEVVAATNVITAAESGKTFFLENATEFVSTLPAPALGLRYTFIVGLAPADASYTIVTTASANIIKGHVLPADGAAGDTEVSGCDTINLVDGAAVAGDRVDVISDGTSWFASARCAVATGITFTTAG